MNRILLILLLATNTCSAQIMEKTICDSVLWSARDAWEYLLKDGSSSVQWKEAAYKYDSNQTLRIDFVKQYVILYGADGELLVEGHWRKYWCASPLFLFHVGVWKVYYPNGRLKQKCRWVPDKKAMLHSIREEKWSWYYDNGFLKKECNYTIPSDDFMHEELFGYYCEYYKNGWLAVEGNYDLKLEDETDTLWKVDPETLQESFKTKVVLRRHSAKTGTWRYYNKDGTLKYKEDYP